MKRVLVTGGAGFIGQHTVRLLEEKGCDVIALDWDRQRLDNMKCLHKICGDMKNQSLMDALLQEYKPEGIIHLGAQSAVTVSVIAPLLDAEQNIFGTMALIEGARRYGVRKIVYASSGGTIYGNPTELPVREGAPLNPQSPYGISKMAAELYIRASGISYAALRYPNVYGPGQDPDGPAGVVAIFIGKMLKNEPCVINGDGYQEKDYVYVEDVAKANIMALESGCEGVYNIGSGEPVTVNKIHQLISAKLGKYISPKHEAAQPGDVRRFWLDASKAKSQLGWEPTIGLEEGIKRTIDYVAGRTNRKSPVSCAGEAGAIPAPATINLN